MSKGWVSYVVGQGRSGHDGTKISGQITMCCPQLRMTLQELFPYHPTQTAPYHRDFQRMGQSGVYKVCIGQGNNLRFILQASKRRRE